MFCATGKWRRLPELSLPEFATYVVFFPSLAAGPIDRAERFAQDLRKEFTLTQDEMFSWRVSASGHRAFQEICRSRMPWH